MCDDIAYFAYFDRLTRWLSDGIHRQPRATKANATSMSKRAITRLMTINAPTDFSQSGAEPSNTSRLVKSDVIDIVTIEQACKYLSINKNYSSALTQTESFAYASVYSHSLLQDLRKTMSRCI